MSEEVARWIGVGVDCSGGKRNQGKKGSAALATLAKLQQYRKKSFLGTSSSGVDSPKEGDRGNRNPDKKDREKLNFLPPGDKKKKLPNTGDSDWRRGPTDIRKGPLPG